MRLIIPDNLKDKAVFKELRILFDGINDVEFNPSRLHDIPSLFDLAKLMNPDLSLDNLNFIYNTIISKKGLTQVITLIANYMNFELNGYDYDDYNLTLIDINNIETDDSNRFIELLYASLNALLFFGDAKVVIRLLTVLLNVNLYHSDPVNIIIESGYTTLTPVYVQ